MKLSRTPRLHNLSDFWQFRQRGTVSSHLRWRSRQVKQPVRTRRDLCGAVRSKLLTAAEQWLICAASSLLLPSPIPTLSLPPCIPGRIRIGRDWRVVSGPEPSLPLSPPWSAPVISDNSPSSYMPTPSPLFGLSSVAGVSVVSAAAAAAAAAVSSARSSSVCPSSLSPEPIDEAIKILRITRSG